MNSNGYKIAIIGAGPSGGILGAYLSKAGFDVTLVDVWKKHMKAISKKGLRINGHKKLKAKFNSSKLKLTTKDLKTDVPDIIFIAVKTPVLKRVVEDLKEIIKEDTLIVSYQNGIGTEDYIADQFNPEIIFRVIINYAGGIIKPGRIDMTFFNSPNYIGSVSPKQHDKAKLIAGILTESGLDTEFQESILPAEWKKGILNSSLSGLCAVTRMTMSEAMQFPNTENLVSNLIKEGIAVANTLGIEFNPDFHDQCMDYLRKGGHHKPSMLIDIENRALSEVEFLNMKIVEVAKENGIDVPYNDSVKSIIEALDFLNGKDRKYISENVKLMGFDKKCLTCSYVKDCIDAFSYCPLHGHAFTHKITGD
ncbi:MAG: ketopantoate reductase family protein [Candidatus Hodarchaeales archaeon]